MMTPVPVSHLHRKQEGGHQSTMIGGLEGTASENRWLADLPHGNDEIRRPDSFTCVGISFSSLTDT